jgi:hypothetical protein
MSDNKELLPCPFCGTQPKPPRTETLDERFGYADQVTIQCPSCLCARGARGDTSKPGYADNSTVEQRAIAAWNRRSAQPVVLSDEQIMQISEDHIGAYGVKPIDFARAILAAKEQANGI